MSIPVLGPVGLPIGVPLGLPDPYIGGLQAV